MSKGLDALTKVILGCGSFVYAREYNIIEKELKALEIIKNKEIDTKYLIRLWKTSEKSDKDILWKFNWYIRLEENKLTQEEYDLLKEVLL